MRDRNRPFGWWGGHEWWGPPAVLSVAELIEAGSLDARMAALFWLMMEHRASLIIAADPPLAGKTTVLTAVLDFLPPEIETVYTQGWAENFDFLGATVPQRTCILCNEISPDLRAYLWGPKVAKLFETLSQGYSLATTIHADSAEEVIKILVSSPLNVPRSLIAHLTLIATIQAFYRDGYVWRRVKTVDFLDEGLVPTPVVTWNPRNDSFEHSSSPSLLESLARWVGMERKAFEKELVQRETLIGQLVVERAESDMVRRAVLNYYRGLTKA